VYGCETWRVIGMDIKRVNTWRRRILRRIYGSVVEQGILIVRNNQELRELYEDLDIVADVKRKRVEY
jgi:hypothetical protein